MGQWVDRKTLWVLVVPLVLAVLGAAVGGRAFALGGFWLGALGAVLWALLDAIGQPRYAWERAYQSRSLWLTLLGAGLLFCGIVGYVAAVAYFASIRRRLRLAA
jgi:hypothetical protein